ncbi:MAG: hypothetical protein JWO81_380 [Alphaproteobacteria bacterium]|nr:hypothetical protein [Alphaproteobacteria bacterium]
MIATEACDRCGWATAGGRRGCRARFEAFLARDFSDPLFFRAHRMFVDTYCLQHPEDFCASAKSLAAHLAGLCWMLEGGAAAAVGPERLHRWLNGERRLDKPPLPDRFGTMTIGDLPQESDAMAWGKAVRAWAESTWTAYADLQPLARRWVAEAAGGEAAPFTNLAR